MNRSKMLIVAVCAVTAWSCATPPPRDAGPPGEQASTALRAGLVLYEAGDFDRAGEQFRDAARVSRANGNRDLAHRALIAECTSWVLARRTSELCSCAGYLEQSQQRRRSSDPRVNTLISLAAIAEGKPLPRLRTPNAVRAVLNEASEEAR